MNRSELSAVCAACAVMIPMLGCGDGEAVGEGLNVSSINAAKKQMELHQAGSNGAWAAWSDHTMPVCFYPSFVERDDFEELSALIREEADSSWPVVADISFTGWEPCAEEATEHGILSVTINPDLADLNLAGRTGGSHALSSNVTTSVAFLMELLPSVPGNGHTVAHEFGHALGFRHLLTRPDFPPEDDCGVHVDAPLHFGDTLFTPPDTDSIMHSACNAATELSFWDQLGAQVAYGPAFPEYVQLALWRGGLGPYENDWATGSLLALEYQQVQASSFALFEAREFKPAQPEGWILAEPREGTIPLYLWAPAVVDPFEHDHYTTTLTEIPQQQDYRIEGIVGYIFEEQQPGTIPLDVYRGLEGQQLRAHVTTTDISITDGDPAISYFYRSTIGYVYADRPWDSAALDFAPEARVIQPCTDEILAENPDAHCVVELDYSGPPLEHRVVGTKPLNTYVDESGDEYLTTSSEQSQAQALAEGFELLRTEGYVYPREGACVHASRNLDVRERSRIKQGNLSIVNSGSGSTDVRADASTGSIHSVASVTLHDRAAVHGSIVSGGSVNVSASANASNVVENADLELATPLDLSDVAFPGSNAGDRYIHGPATLAPGSYARVAVYSGATLTLGSGTYYVTHLQLEPQSTLVLDQAAGPTTLYVESSVVYRGQALDNTGALASLFLGYLGSQSVTLEAPFRGTVVAPNAALLLGTGNGMEFSGRYVARDFELRAGTVLNCEP